MYSKYYCSKSSAMQPNVTRSFIDRLLYICYENRTKVHNEVKIQINEKAMKHINKVSVAAAVIGRAITRKFSHTMAP